MKEHWSRVHPLKNKSFNVLSLNDLTLFHYIILVQVSVFLFLHQVYILVFDQKLEWQRIASIKLAAFKTRSSFRTSGQISLHHPMIEQCHQWLIQVIHLWGVQSFNSFLLTSYTTFLTQCHSKWCNFVHIKVLFIAHLWTQDRCPSRFSTLKYWWMTYEAIQGVIHRSHLLCLNFTHLLMKNYGWIELDFTILVHQELLDLHFQNSKTYGLVLNKLTLVMEIILRYLSCFQLLISFLLWMKFRNHWSICDKFLLQNFIFRFQIIDFWLQHLNLRWLLINQNGLFAQFSLQILNKDIMIELSNAWVWSVSFLDCATCCCFDFYLIVI